MRRAFISVAPLVLSFVLALTAEAQNLSSATAAETPDFLTANFPVRKEVEVDLKSTSRIPNAKGKAEIKNEKGMTRIEVKLEGMKPAVLFGGDFNTYVLWLITPEGEVQNLGEFILDRDDAKLEATTPISDFGIFVTAEPHFLVDFPSRMVVLTMGQPADGRASDFRTAQLRNEGVKGLYDFTRETLAGTPEIRRDDLASDLAQARTAVRLAERAGAKDFAAVDLQAARQALQRAEEAAVTDKHAENRMTLSREAVRLAVKAQTVAQDRLLQAQLKEERERTSQEAERLKAATAAARSEAEKARLEANAAQQARQEAERAAQIAQQQQGSSEATRTLEQAREAAGAAEQRYQELSLEQQHRDQMVLEAERALHQAEQDQQSAQNSPPRTDADRVAAQQQVDRARAELEQARRDAEQARERAKQAEAEAGRAKEVAAQRQQELDSRQAGQQTAQRLNQLQTEQVRTRQELRNVLGQMAETQETTEGLIVNLPDILFESGSAALKPQAREVLQKIAQTLGSKAQFRLRIEGFTDNLGRPEHNRELSEARAKAVRDFLVNSGLDQRQIIEVRGMGENAPRASNDSAEGRQANRRVEIIVQESTAPVRAE